MHVPTNVCLPALLLYQWGSSTNSTLLEEEYQLLDVKLALQLSTDGTVSAKIAPWLKCYKNASRLNRYNFPTDNAIDFLFSIIYSEVV